MADTDTHVTERILEPLLPVPASRSRLTKVVGDRTTALSQVYESPSMNIYFDYDKSRK
jgi:hypothetical protein